MRREDIHVGETEGERPTKQMTRYTLGRTSHRPLAMLRDFSCAAVTDAEIVPIVYLHGPHV